MNVAVDLGHGTDRGRDMQSQVWTAVLRHIPAEQHNQYMLVTSGGAEIAIQSLLRLEEQFAIVKGRLSGSQDAGRVFFIPYANIDYVGTSQPVKDVDFNAVFDSLVVPASEPLPPISPSGQGTQMRNEPPPRPAIRSEILDRFRSRPGSSAHLPTPRTNGT